MDEYVPNDIQYNAGLFMTFKDKKIKIKYIMERKHGVNPDPITFPKKGIKNTLNYYLSLFTYSHI